MIPHHSKTPGSPIFIHALFQSLRISPDQCDRRLQFVRNVSEKFARAILDFLSPNVFLKLVVRPLFQFGDRLFQLRDIVLKLSPNTPISLSPPRVYLASKSKFAIRWDSCTNLFRIGSVIFLEKNQTNTAPKNKRHPPAYSKND